MRILFTSAAGLGHLHPLVPFMRAAVAAGDEVLVALPSEGVPKVQALGFPAVAVPVPGPEEVGAVWSRLPAEGQNLFVVTEVFIRLQARAALAATRALVDTYRPQLVVSEVTELSGAVAAEDAGVAHLVVGISALDLDDLDESGVTDAVDDLREALGRPRTGSLPWRDGRAFASAVPPELWGDPRNAPAHTTWVRHEDAEGPAVPAPRRAGGGRPSVYATLGSVAGGQKLAAQAYSAVLAGLRDVDADVLFTIGSLDRALLGPVPPHVTVESYVPQSAAMDCDAVVLHGGAGSTVAALSRGLPIVTVPLFADQFHNGERVAAAGAGVVVDVAAAAASLPGAVAEVLVEPSYAASARRIAARIAARPPASRVLDALRPAAALVG